MFSREEKTIEDQIINRTENQLRLSSAISEVGGDHKQGLIIIAPGLFTVLLLKSVYSLGYHPFLEGENKVG